MKVEVVLKFGGSLERNPTFPEICKWTGRSLRSEKAVIMPGGGRFADVVRVCDKQWGLNAATSHWMAVLAMEQFGYVLAERIPDSVTSRTETDIARAHAAGILPVFLPVAWLRKQRDVPESWDVSSDSIACLLAAGLRASRLVLLKDSLPEEARSGEDQTEDVLRNLALGGWVDPMFTRFLSSWRGEAWLCDGTKGLALGTEVRCGGNRCLRLQ
ncbi:MAG: amino acid kinase [Thermovirgaceae bacterium]